MGVLLQNNQDSIDLVYQHLEGKSTITTRYCSRLHYITIPLCLLEVGVEFGSLAHLPWAKFLRMEVVNCPIVNQS